MNRLSYLSMCMSAGILASCPVFAEQSPQCADDNKNCTSEQRIQQLEKTVVTATRTETDDASFAGQIGVVYPVDLERSANVVDALSTIPGFEAGGDVGRNIGSQFTIRGFGYQSEARVIIRQNGVPQSPSLFSNHISSFRTDTDILNHVEVVKGASSVLYGSGAIGGIVNMQTKKATDFLTDGESLGVMIGGRYESNNMHSIRAGLYGRSRDVPVDFLVYAKQADYGDIDLAGGGTEDYQTIGNDESIDTAYATVGFDISDEQRITFSVFDFDESLNTVWQTLYHYEIDTSSPITGSLQQTDYVLDYSWESNDNTLLDLDIKLYSNDAYYDRGWDDYEPETGERDTLQYKNEESRRGFNIKNLATFSTGDIAHRLLTGIDFNNREEDAVYIRNGVPTQFNSMPNTYDDWGLYIQDIMSYQALELTLGGRFDKFDREVHQSGATEYKNNHFSPRIALAYSVTPRLNLLLGYSETFRAPTPHETSSVGALNPHYYYMANPDLQAETAREIEGGFAYNARALLTDSDQLSLKATYFEGKINKLISLQPRPELGDPPESTTYAQYMNVENARRRGLEVNADYLIDAWRITSTFEHLKLYDEATGEDVNQSFADKIQLSATYYADAVNLEIGANVEHWFAPDPNPATVMSGGVLYTYVDQAFTQVNLRGKWDIPLADTALFSMATVNFGISNLTDKKYINARYTNTTSRVGTGRNTYIDIELRF